MNFRMHAILFPVVYFFQRKIFTFSTLKVACSLTGGLNHALLFLKSHFFLPFFLTIARGMLYLITYIELWIVRVVERLHGICFAVFSNGTSLTWYAFRQNEGDHQFRIPCVVLIISKSKFLFYFVSRSSTIWLLCRCKFYFIFSSGETYICPALYIEFSKLFIY